MYVLNRNDFRATDKNRVVEFVECWERYYRGNDLEYFAELNLGGDLTEQNIMRLLRWKDPRFLTHPKKKGGGSNQHVTRVLERMVSINSFRNGYLTVDDFGTITRRIFPTGIIWQLFLFHVARPTDWPIADQNVFRSYSVLFNVTVPNSINSFRSYADAFQELAANLRSAGGIDDADPELVVRANKRLDNALVAFGQFLATYDR
jgi:hypothetical protein